ncbi:hypothetical protein P4S72_06240 [Vibrio sp. PP-XX7]
MPLLPIDDSAPDGNGTADENALPAWRPAFVVDESETSITRLNRLTQDMVSLYGDYFDKLVFFFIPPTIASEQDWIAFITQFAKFTTNKVRFGVIENLTPFEPVQQAPNLPETQIYHFCFQGQSYDMMLGVLDDLEAQDELVDFRRYLTQTFQYQSQQAPEKAIQAAQSALQIAQQRQLKEAQVVALTSMYAICVSQNDYEGAQQHTLQALNVAQTVTREELPARDQLEAMAYTNLATAQFLHGHYDCAAESYQSAAALFEQQENWMMTYESLRMRVLCLTQLKQYTQAWEQGGDALVAFYQTPEDLWPNGTLAWLGKNLLQVSSYQEKSEQLIFEAHLADLLGETWQQSVDSIPMSKLPPQHNGSLA